MSLLWLANFVVEFGIVVSLSKPHPGNPPVAALALVVVIGFWFALAAHVYLSLAIRTLTANTALLDRVWKHRIWIHATMVAFGAIYYSLK